MWFFFGQGLSDYILYIFSEGVCPSDSNNEWTHCKHANLYADPSSQAASSCIRKAWRTSWMERNHGECLCADKRIISSYSEELYGPKNKMFSRKLILPFIFCGLIFEGWFLICVGLNVLHTFCNILMTISCMLVMICHVREIRHMY